VTWHGVNLMSLLRKSKVLIDVTSLQLLQRGVLFPLASTPGSFEHRPFDLPRFDPQLPPKYLTPNGQRQLRKVRAQCPTSLVQRRTRLRIVVLRFGTARQKMHLERWTNPNRSRRTSSPQYGLRPCRGESAGVAKRPRDLISHRNPQRFATFSSPCALPFTAHCIVVVGPSQQNSR
jgi:hypothetical protein